MTPCPFVKLFVLDASGCWDDRGIGTVAVEPAQTEPGFVLRVIAESDGALGLVVSIANSTRVTYNLQNGTIIAWTEPRQPIFLTTHSMSSDKGQVSRSEQASRKSELASEKKRRSRAQDRSSPYKKHSSSDASLNTSCNTCRSSLDDIAENSNIAADASVRFHSVSVYSDGSAHFECRDADDSVPDLAHSESTKQICPKSDQKFSQHRIVEQKDVQACSSSYEQCEWTVEDGREDNKADLSGPKACFGPLPVNEKDQGDRCESTNGTDAQRQSHNLQKDNDVHADRELNTEQHQKEYAELAEQGNKKSTDQLENRHVPDNNQTNIKDDNGRLRDHQNAASSRNDQMVSESKHMHLPCCCPSHLLRCGNDRLCVSYPSHQPVSDSAALLHEPVELALSFAEASACRRVYEKILLAQNDCPDAENESCALSPDLQIQQQVSSAASSSLSAQRKACVRGTDADDIACTTVATSTRGPHCKPIAATTTDTVCSSKNATSTEPVHGSLNIFTLNTANSPKFTRACRAELNFSRSQPISVADNEKTENCSDSRVVNTNKSQISRKTKHDTSSISHSQPGLTQGLRISNASLSCTALRSAALGCTQLAPATVYKTEKASPVLSEAGRTQARLAAKAALPVFLSIPVLNSSSTSPSIPSFNLCCNSSSAAISAGSGQKLKAKSRSKPFQRPNMDFFTGCGTLLDDFEQSGSPLAVWAPADLMEDTTFDQAEPGPCTTEALVLTGAGLHAGHFSTLSAGVYGGCMAGAGSFSLPPPDRCNLEHLANILAEPAPLQTPGVRERAIAELSTGSYVSHLCEVFRLAEDMLDVEALRLLYVIFRSLFQIGDNAIIENLVNNQNILSVIGALEYDPEVFPSRPADGGSLAFACRSAICGADGLPSDDHHSDAALSPAGLSASQQIPVYEPPFAATRSESVGSNSIGIQDAELDCGSLESHTESANSSQSAVPVTNGAANRAFADSFINAPAGHVATSDNSTVVRNCAQSSSDIAPQPRDAPSDWTSSVIVSPPSLDLENRPRPSRTSTACHDHAASSSSVNDLCEESSEDTCGGAEDSVDGKGSDVTTSSIGPTDNGVVIRRHRDCLMRQTSSQSVVSIPDENVFNKILQNYRIIFLKDVVLPGVLNDLALNALSSLVFCNNIDIVMYFLTEQAPFEDLFEQFNTCIRVQRASGLIYASCGDLRRIKDETTSAVASSRTGCGSRLPKADDDGLGSAQVGNGGCSGKRARMDGSADAMERSSKRDSPSDVQSSDETHPDGRLLQDEESSAVRVCKRRRISLSEDQEQKSSSDVGRGSSDRTLSKWNNPETLRLLLGFLNEICTLAKSQQSVVRNKLYSVLREFGVLEVALETLKHRNREIRLLGSDILSMTVLHDQCDIRMHILQSAIEDDTQAIGRGEAGNHGCASSSAALCDLAGSAPFRLRSQLLPATESAAATRSAVDGCQSNSRCPGNHVGPAGVSRSQDEDLGCADSDSAQEQLSVSGDGKEPVGDTMVSGGVKSAQAPTSSSQPADDDVDVDVDVDGSCQRSGTNQSSPSSCSAHVGRSPLPEEDDSNRKFPLLNAVMDVLCNNTASGVFLTVCDLMKCLLDTSTMRSVAERDQFLDIFYQRFMSRLVEPLSLRREDDITLEGFDKERKPDDVDCNKSHLCDLLSYCAAVHGYRMKYFVQEKDALGKVLQLLKHRRPHVRLSALRFLRSCVGTCDDFYDRYIVKKGLQKLVFNMFAANCHKDNLINSACLEYVSFLADKRRFSLLQDIMDNYADHLQGSKEYSSVFTDAERVFKTMKASWSASTEEGPRNVSSDVKSPARHGCLVQNVVIDGTATVDRSLEGSHLALMQRNSDPVRNSLCLHPGRDICVAPDVDEDEGYFASEDLDNDYCLPGVVSESQCEKPDLCRDKEPLLACLGDSSDEDLGGKDAECTVLSDGGIREVSATESTMSTDDRREFPTVRCETRTDVARNNSSICGTSSAPRAAVDAVSAQLKGAANSHQLISQSAEGALDNVNVSLLSSDYVNEITLVEYAAEDESDELFCPDSNLRRGNSSPSSSTNPERPPRESSRSIKWEEGMLKDTLKVSRDTFNADSHATSSSDYIECGADESVKSEKSDEQNISQ